MALKIFGPRKRRTRQHVIADIAVHHVEGLVLEEGHTAERRFRDYGYDLVMSTYDEDGFVEPDLVYFQIKASERLNEVRGAFVCDIDMRDYNLWLREQTPVILVLYDAEQRKGYWLDVKDYFTTDESRQPDRSAKWIRVRVPKRQRINRGTIVRLRRLKAMTRDINRGYDGS